MNNITHLFSATSFYSGFKGLVRLFTEELDRRSASDQERQSIGYIISRFEGKLRLAVGIGPSETWSDLGQVGRSNWPKTVAEFNSGDPVTADILIQDVPADLVPLIVQHAAGLMEDSHGIIRHVNEKGFACRAEVFGDHPIYENGDIDV